MTTPAGALPTSTFHLMSLGLEVEGDHLPLCCRVTNTVFESVSNAMWLGMPSMKMRPASLKLPSAVVDVDVIEPVGGGDEPLAVRAEAQLIGIDDVAHDAAALAGLGVEHQQLVGDGRADQHFLAVGRRDQVMRLAAERQALPASTRPLRLRML